MKSTNCPDQTPRQLRQRVNTKNDDASGGNSLPLVRQRRRRRNNPRGVNNDATISGYHSLSSSVRRRPLRFLMLATAACIFFGTFLVVVGGINDDKNSGGSGGGGVEYSNLKKGPRFLAAVTGNDRPTTDRSDTVGQRRSDGGKIGNDFVSRRGLRDAASRNHLTNIVSRIKDTVRNKYGRRTADIRTIGHDTPSAVRRDAGLGIPDGAITTNDILPRINDLSLPTAEQAVPIPDQHDSGIIIPDAAITANDIPPSNTDHSLPTPTTPKQVIPIPIPVPVPDEQTTTQIRTVNNNSDHAAHNRTRRYDITCTDGSQGIRNDDYCDCLDDGSDEPHTSACSHVRVQVISFRCEDGLLSIYGSRVGDGVVDCADGSDERRR